MLRYVALCYVVSATHTSSTWTGPTLRKRVRDVEGKEGNNKNKLN